MRNHTLALPVMLAALIAGGCASRDALKAPGIAYIETTPEKIVAIACRERMPNCRRVIALAVFDLRPCVVYLPPPSSADWIIIPHENRHCREGHWHPRERAR